MKNKYMPSKRLPDLDFLKEYFSYNPGSGNITWNKQYSSINAGSIAGNAKKTTSHIVIGIGRRTYLAHRVAWMLYYGQDPHPSMIDHVDGDKTNNKISNLRLADYSENNCNARIRKDNKSGAKGVSFHKATGKWLATIKKNNKRYYLGVFPTVEEAEQVVSQARSCLHLEFTKHA